MRKTINDLFLSIQMALGLINRTINTADKLVATVEAQAVAYHDEELDRLAQEASSRSKAIEAN